MYAQGVGSSGKIDSDGAVGTGGKRIFLYGYIIRHGTGTQSGAAFKDGGSGGTTLWHHTRSAQDTLGNVCDAYAFTKPLEFPSGLYVDLSGTDTEVYVIYQEL